jgi:hypothetical protein
MIRVDPRCARIGAYGQPEGRGKKGCLHSPPVDAWKRDLIGRIADEIDRYGEGDLSLRRLVENARGLFDAADISDQSVREAFELAWAPLSGQLDLRTAEWADPAWASEVDLETALRDLREWASQISNRSIP